MHLLLNVKIRPERLRLMAPDLRRRPLRGPSQIESLVWSEGVHLNNSSFVRISAGSFVSRRDGEIQTIAFNA